MMSLSFMMRSSWPSILTSVPDHLPNSTLSFGFTSRGTILPLSSRAPGADGDDLALLGFLGCRIGDDDAAGGLGFAVDAAHNHAVVQRTELHGLKFS